VNEEEIEKLAHSLALEIRAFLKIYTRKTRGGISLRERKDGECVFFDPDSGCGVYELRPHQCRTWPFWRAVVRSPDRWLREARDCPGMNTGPLHTLAEIRCMSENDGTGGEP